MRRMFGLLLTSLCLLMGTGACSHRSLPAQLLSPEQQALQSWTQFEDRFLDTLWRLDPDWALSVGHTRYRDTIVIPNATSRAQSLAFYRQMKSELLKIDPKTLPLLTQTDWQLVAEFLDESQWRLEQLQAYRWNPAAYNLSPGIARLFETQSLSEVERFRSASLRLAAARDYYAAAQASIDDPTLEHTTLAIKQLQDIPAYWQETLGTKVDATALDAQEKSLFHQRLTAATAAVQEHIKWLTQLRDRLSRGQARSFRLPPALYRQKFIYELGSSSTPEEIYARALKAKDETLAKMDQLASQLYPRYVPGRPSPDRLQRIKRVVAELSKKHPEPQNFRRSIEAQLPELVSFVKDKNLVFLDPAKPLVVRDTPLYARGVAGASVESPGPYDKSGETYYNVTPLDSYSNEQAQSYLREYNNYTLQILNIHEAIPGHYAQLLHANESPSLIKSIFGNGTMIEGWAVYAERMMLEQGYAESPELWLMYYKWHMRVILNTILDYEIHNKNLTRADGLRLLTKFGFQEQAEAEEKWKRATLTQVQLASYFTGYSEIYSLRAEMQAAEGDRFQLRAFHDRFLSYGSAPIKYIRELLLKPKVALNAP